MAPDEPSSRRSEAVSSTRRVRNDHAELQGLSAWLRRFVEHVGAGAATTASLELCVHEVVTNVIDHAFLDDDLHEIVVRLEDHETEIVAIVEDDGAPFDPLTVPPRAKPRTLDEATVRGYGLPILRALAGRLAYERTADRNRFTLAFRK
jgi:serine/threonine-protein kinase RsbW